MIRSGLRQPSALVLALALGPLSGCGSSSSSPAGNGIASKSPAQIVQAARAAATGAATAHIGGSLVSEGKPVSLDMELVAGKGGKGTITLEGLSVELIQADGAVFIKGSPAFYRHLAGSAAARLLEGKWVKAPLKSGSFGSLASLTNLGQLIGSTLGDHGPLVRAGRRTIASQQAVGVTDKARGGTLYVAATGTPYPIEVLKPGSGGGRISFDRWNQPVSLSAPTNAVNINQLQSGA